MTQESFYFSLSAECGPAGHGERKAWVLSLALRDPVIVDSESIARSCYGVARRLGLRASVQKVEREARCTPEGVALDTAKIVIDGVAWRSEFPKSPAEAFEINQQAQQIVDTFNQREPA